MDFNMFDLDFEDIGLSSSTAARVRDVYAGADLGVFTGRVANISVPLHGCRALQVFPLAAEGERNTLWRPWHKKRSGVAAGEL